MLDFVSESLIILWTNSCVTLKYLKPGSDVIRFLLQRDHLQLVEGQAGGGVRCWNHSGVFMYNSSDYGFGLGCWVIPSAVGEHTGKLDECNR